MRKVGPNAPNVSDSTSVNQTPEASQVPQPSSTSEAPEINEPPEAKALSDEGKSQIKSQKKLSGMMKRSTVMASSDLPKATGFKKIEIKEDYDPRVTGNAQSKIPAGSDYPKATAFKQVEIKEDYDPRIASGPAKEAGTPLRQRQKSVSARMKQSALEASLSAQKDTELPKATVHGRKSVWEEYDGKPATKPGPARPTSPVPPEPALDVRPKVSQSIIDTPGIDRCNLVFSLRSCFSN